MRENRSPFFRCLCRSLPISLSGLNAPAFLASFVSAAAFPRFLLPTVISSLSRQTRATHLSFLSQQTELCFCLPTPALLPAFRGHINNPLIRFIPILPFRTLDRLVPSQARADARAEPGVIRGMVAFDHSRERGSL